MSGVSAAPKSADRLHEWVAQLTESTRKRVKVGVKKDTRTLTVTVPSLWSQLTSPDMHPLNRSSGGGLALGSKPPLNLGAVSLACQIDRAVWQGGTAIIRKRDTIERADWIGLRGYGLTGFMATDRNLRRLAVHVAGLPDKRPAEILAEQVRIWVAQVLAVLPHEEDAPTDRPLRDHPCPRCAADFVVKIEDDGTYREPALAIQFREGRSRAIVCRACEAVFWAGEEFHRLHEHAEQLRAEVAA